ncbi:MAG: ubiquitin-like protein [Candidatus Bathyarchaeia archaeon]
MRLFVQAPIGPQTGLAEIDVIPDHTIGEIKHQVCNSFGVDASTVALMYAGTVLDDNTTVGQAGIPENAQLALMPYNIVGGAAPWI